MTSFQLHIVVIFAVLGVSFASFPQQWFQRIADENLAASDNLSGGKKVPKLASLDQVTYTLVDTTLFFMQVGKTFGYITEGFDGPIGPFWDWTYNTTRVKCENGCVTENIFMEINEPYFDDLETIKLTTDFQLTKLNLTLHVGELLFDLPGYRHTITNNVSRVVRVGETARFTLSNATYGLIADYQLVPGVGIQVSNVDITLDIGEETWTVENRYTILENGMIIDDGLYEGDLKEGVMSTWTGQYEGELFEKKYEQWAEILLNCGLSGGNSSENCKDVKGQIAKYKSMFPKQ